MNYKVTRDEFVKILYEDTDFKRDFEEISILDSIGRTLYEDVHSNNTLPNQKTSGMDGIAFAFDNLEKNPIEKWILDVDYIYANTGVAIRDEFDTVVPIEMVSVEEDRLHIEKLPDKKGVRVNEIGSTILKDELLISRDTVIRPSHISLLAAGGIRNIKVIKKPIVAVIPTGNELISYGMPVPIGKNVETNSLMLKASIEEWGGIANIFPIIPDDKNLLIDTLKTAVEESDIVIFNAGSSKGTMDYTLDVFKEVGEVVFKGLLHGPAKPTCYALSDNTPIIGIVGPPIGAELTTNWYLRPLMDNFLNRPLYKWDKLEIELMDDFKNPMPFEFYSQVEIVKKDGKYIGYSINNKRTSRISASTEANALVKIPAKGCIEKGSIVEVELKIREEYIKNI